MEKMINATIGIDVSKDHLDAHRLPDVSTKLFTNDGSGHKALIRWVKTTAVDRIVFEVTGLYTRDLEQALAGAGLPAVKVNPRQARRFAEAVGTLAKTDAVDAAMLARMGKALELAPSPPPSKNIMLLKELLLARYALIKDQTAAKNGQKVASVPVVKKMLSRRIDQVERDIATIDAEITRQIAENAELAKRVAILLSIPGVGAVTAAVLIIEMPELGTNDHKQAASLAGAAPMARQSCSWTGKAHIRGGRAALHARHGPRGFNPALKDIYNRIIDAGKSAKVAITAVMRKLICLANALLRKGRPWAQNPACA